MNQFHVYTGAEKPLAFEMLDRQLMDSFQKWLADKKKSPDHFIGADKSGKPIAISFPLVVAIAELAAPLSHGISQGSQALRGRPLSGS